MKKNFIIRSFLKESKEFNYKNEIIPYIYCFLIYLTIWIIIYFIDRDNSYKTGILSAILLILFFYQTYALMWRLVEVHENKIDLKIMNNNYTFKHKSQYVSYVFFKKLVINSFDTFKIYCSDINDNYHVIHIVSYLQKKNNSIIKQYYFDRIEYKIDIFLFEINDKKINVDSKIKILGFDFNEKYNNEEIINMLKKRYNLKG